MTAVAFENPILWNVLNYPATKDFKNKSPIKEANTIFQRWYQDMMIQCMLITTK